MAPTGQGGQWQDVLLCSICSQHFSESVLPVNLICGHVICRVCADKWNENEKPCPVDDWKTTIRAAEYPTNVALLTIIHPQKQGMSFSVAKTETEKRIDQQLCQIAKFFREIETERGGTVSSKFQELSRTLQRKVLALLCYQYLEADGRQKTLKMCRGISERVMVEIILSIQSNIHVSSQLWSAVRARGCQFLGPAMQDDVLRLILMTLETGECIARKNLVMYVVQTLESDYPQVSKTCVGHVVQLLYRASCFNVLKRDGESSLMQLKDEFRTYESLRREHDSQIVQIAFESGLRIGPDQWSALLYADQNHRSHMQSIIDKLQSRSTYVQGIQELRHLSSSPDSMMMPAYKFFLSQVVPCLEFFAASESEEATIELIGEALHQIRTLLRLHVSQEELRKQDRRMVRPTYHADPTVVDREKLQKKNPTPPPPPPPQSLPQIPHNIPPPPAIPPILPQQQQQRRKRYQMGIPPQRQEFLQNFQYHQNHQNPNYYRQIPPPPQPQMVHQTPNRRGGGQRRMHDHQQPQGPHRSIPMLIPPPSYPMMPTGTADVVTSDGQGNESTQRVVIMQSPTHPHTGPVVMIPQQPLVGGPSVTPVPMGPPQWTPSPTGSTMIYPAQSPPGQPPHTIWISQEGSMFPTFDYSGGMIWGPTTMLRESGADAEQLLAKRHEILKRLQPSEDDDDPEDGGVGHVSYTVASSVLDDSYRMDHHPIAMIPVEAIPMTFTPMANEETVTMMGEIVQGRPRAPSITTAQTAPILMAAATAQTSTTVVPMVQSECTATVPQPMPLFPLEVPVVPVVPVPETFNPSVPPPPPPGQPMLVDSATGLLTPIRPILVAHPQNVVSNSLDKIVDVKERLSEANGCASEAENAHLRMELRMAESEMAHLDPFTKNNCLLRELQQVDRELQQLQIEPARQ